MLETIHPKDERAWLELRVKDITSSEVAALFGISPYLTAFELWHRKKEGNVVDANWNERMKWGIRLQDSIAKGIAEDNGWTVRRMDEYMTDTVLRIGSSFDYEVSIGESSEKGILEIKNVDGLIYRDQWLENDDGTVEAPPHIEIQIQHQLAVSGYPFAILAPLINGNKVVLIKRTPDPKIIDAIKAKIVQFWQSIEKNTPPPPDFRADADFISKLYQYAEPGRVLDAQGDAEIASLVAEYKKAQEIEKEAGIQKDAAKAKLLTKIGEAEKVLGDGFSITAGVVGEAEISYVRKSYRNFRVNFPRGKKNV